MLPSLSEPNSPIISSHLKSLSPSPPLTPAPDGNLQHTESGLFVHPLKGSAYSGCVLVLHPAGPERRLAFQTMHAADLSTSGFLTHVETGLCLVCRPPFNNNNQLQPHLRFQIKIAFPLSHLHVQVPRSGRGVSGCDLIFTDDVEAADADFRFVTSKETLARAEFAAEMGQAGAEQAKDALQRRGEQLQQAAERSQKLQVGAWAGRRRGDCGSISRERWWCEC
jgi:hypothetical protein